MIAELVQTLPELYQPIYGHPELSGAPSRPCEDRLGPIAGAHDALARLLGRPLKVLDLGCAQGFFSLQLAERGAIVHGVDFLDKNIAVCMALAAEHPQLTVSFETGRVEDTIGRLTADQYDLVLGLSVFHHIVHEKGVGEVTALLERVGRDCGAMLVELALHDEPLYWGGSQPQQPRSLLASVAFVHELGWHETHLSQIARPLYVASNRYWIFDERAGKFDSWTEEPHALAQGTHEGSRRYFFSSDAIAKLYRFDHARGKHNKAEFSREARFLTQPPPSFNVPACFACGTDETHGWVAFERWPGSVLLDVLQQGGPIEHQRIVVDVLEQLAALESGGLYHNDVRTWNVLLAHDGSARLIDYGSISEIAADCVWPQDIFLAFFIFVHEVVNGVVDDPAPLRTVAFSPYQLPQPYRTWAAAFWLRNRHDWTFHDMHDTFVAFLKKGGQPGLEPSISAMDAWMSAIEQAINVNIRFGKRMVGQLEAERQKSAQELNALRHAQTRHSELLGECFDKIESLASLTEQRLAGAESQAKKLSETLAYITQLLEATDKAARKRTIFEQHQQANEMEVALNHTRQQLLSLDAERNKLLASWSWRITAPLRLVACLLTHPLRTLRSGVNIVIHRSICIAERPLSRLISTVLHRPRISHRISQWLLHYPALYQQLIGVARRGGVLPADLNYADTNYSKSCSNDSMCSVDASVEEYKSFYLQSTKTSEFKQVDVEDALKAIRLELQIFRGGK